MHIDECDARSLIIAIRRINRELVSRGVTQRMSQLNLGTRKLWSPASSKASYSRWSRRKNTSLLRTKHVVILSPAANFGGDSTSDRSEEDTICEA